MNPASETPKTGSEWRGGRSERAAPSRSCGRKWVGAQAARLAAGPPGAPARIHTPLSACNAPGNSANSEKLRLSAIKQNAWGAERGVSPSRLPAPRRPPKTGCRRAVCTRAAAPPSRGVGLRPLAPGPAPAGHRGSQSPRALLATVLFRNVAAAHLRSSIEKRLFHEFISTGSVF